MYELIVLGLLMRSPRHGYLIARVINDIIGPWAKISNGGLYPLLSRLEKSALIVCQSFAEGHVGERRQRVFAIANAGRRRFSELMLNTTSNPGEYQKVFWLKALFLDLVDRDDRLYLLNHYIDCCQTHLDHLHSKEMERRQRALRVGPEESRQRETAGTHYMTRQHQRLASDGLGHRADHWQLDLAWAQRLRAEEMDASVGALGDPLESAADPAGLQP